MRGENIGVTYILVPVIETVERVCDLLLAEMTTGIQYISTESGVEMYPCEDNLAIMDQGVKGEVVSIQEKGENEYVVEFAIPADNINPQRGGIPNLLAVIAGEVFSFYCIERAGLVDVKLPDSYYEHYKGPQFGIRGIRELLDVYDRPLFGAIIKPNLGLTPEGAAAIVSILCRAGFDFVKDDEIMIDPRSCPLEERVGRIAEEIDKAKGTAKSRMLYFADVTSDYAELIGAAEAAIRAGADGVMIDPFPMGISAISALRSNISRPIYCHRVGYGLFCGNGNFSISYEVFSALFRMLGADFSHVGGISGKSKEGRTNVAHYLEILRGANSLRGTWPVVTGIHLGNVADYYQFYGNDVLFMDCVGIYKDVASSTQKLHSMKKEMGLQ